MGSMIDIHKVGVGNPHTIFLYMEGNMSDIFIKEEGTDPYKLLANAVVIQAVKDYKSGYINDHEFRRFLFGEWYQMLTGVSGSYLYRRITDDCKRTKRRN